MSTTFHFRPVIGLKASSSAKLSDQAYATLMP